MFFLHEDDKSDRGEEKRTGENRRGENRREQERGERQGRGEERRVAKRTEDSFSVVKVKSIPSIKIQNGIELQ